MSTQGTDFSNTATVSVSDLMFVWAVWRLSDERDVWLSEMCTCVIILTPLLLKIKLWQGIFHFLLILAAPVDKSEAKFTLPERRTTRLQSSFFLRQRAPSVQPQYF